MNPESGPFPTGTARHFAVWLCPDENARVETVPAAMASSAAAAGRQGRSTVNVVPSPSRLST
jgi:hypothetical protein